MLPSNGGGNCNKRSLVKFVESERNALPAEFVPPHQ